MTTSLISHNFTRQRPPGIAPRSRVMKRVVKHSKDFSWLVFLALIVCFPSNISYANGLPQPDDRFPCTTAAPYQIMFGLIVGLWAWVLLTILYRRVRREAP